MELKAGYKQTEVGVILVPTRRVGTRAICGQDGFYLEVLNEKERAPDRIPPLALFCARSVTNWKSNSA